jgi:hypothetical protein
MMMIQLFWKKMLIRIHYVARNNKVFLSQGSHDNDCSEEEEEYDTHKHQTNSTTASKKVLEKNNQSLLPPLCACCVTEVQMTMMANTAVSMKSER